METKLRSCIPEIWGGIECTINRVGNLYRDQLAETGHYMRTDDIEQIATLGIRKIRYPVLWESHTPDRPGKINWQSTSSRLLDILRKDIIPIAGLLHHGSGPTHTSLLDDAFSAKLASYAKVVASKFPWLEYYTPVNEPLTTARFSGLYGFWYPHFSDERNFFLMLLNQVKGIILSMRAIRTINPAAKLVQTEDLCKVHSTPALAYQAAFENERRWLTYDLLCGKFTPGHPLWNHFLSLNIPETTLSFFSENPCPPDIMGFNYYVTSERALDEKIDNYPQYTRGGNGRHKYADIDAARLNKRAGLPALLEEAWERYHLPMAVTECHLNCSREEQMRWLKETWESCCVLNTKGIPVVALTAWSLLGSFDWDSLLLQQNMHYESGVFDISGGNLRPTILAKMINAFSRGQSFTHPLLKEAGWWNAPPSYPGNVDECLPLLILEANPEISKNFERICKERRINYIKISVKHFMNLFVRGDNPFETKTWSIIIANSDHEENTALLECVGKYCTAANIPCMLYPFNGLASFIQQQDIPQGNPWLLVQTEIGKDLKSAHQAMDLLIDGEKGSWAIGENGARKLNQEQPAVLY